LKINGLLFPQEYSKLEKEGLQIELLVMSLSSSFILLHKEE